MICDHYYHIIYTTTTRVNFELPNVCSRSSVAPVISLRVVDCEYAQWLGTVCFSLRCVDASLREIVSAVQAGVFCPEKQFFYTMYFCIIW
jgi:hypothetical protein